MREQPLLHRIMLRCSTGAGRLFRMNVGLAWIGKAEKVIHVGQAFYLSPGDVVIYHARPFRSGLKGMSDLLGWETVEITPEMVGQKFAVFCSVEVKGAGGRVKKEQQRWIDLVKIMGGRAGIARSEEQAEQIMQGKC